MTLLGDTAGSVPGLAAVASGAKASTAAARAALSAAPETSALAGLGTGAGAFGRTTWSTGNELRQVENPLAGWALRSSTPEVRERVGVGFAGAGALTAGLDYVGDSDAVEYSTTAVDGTRVVLDDAPSVGAKSAHFWTAVRPR
ncbi:hypothetical protein [Streptomyces sp. NBC_01408]|uniref:hypothetical protein n=1 Tax=Streptomyces sp. NBC_01408 TaxID=2903855 RepID=UPI00224FEA6C|nr:hypothetical protein [Streptomyces sp. NBC_01408]MCX4695965.1 hypothetical protein [Streptomyces sp. NBC_01408]